MSESPPQYGFRPDICPTDSSLSYSPVHLSYATHMPMPIRRSNSTSSASEQNENSEPTRVSRHCWQLISPGVAFPYDCAIRAGTDADGSPIYAGRAFHEGNLIPAKVLPQNNIAYVSHGGEEVPKDSYEVLRNGTFVWEFATNGAVPEGAVEVGCADDGEKLYMGRAMHGGAQTPGKLHPSHGCLYIPFGGAEVLLTEYEVLVSK